MRKRRPHAAHLLSHFTRRRRIAGAFILEHEQGALSVIGDPESGARIGRWFFEVIEIGGASGRGGGGEGLCYAEIGILEHGGGEEEAEGVAVGFVGQGGGEGEVEVLEERCGGGGGEKEEWTRVWKRGWGMVWERRSIIMASMPVSPRIISLQRVGCWGSPRLHDEGSRVPSAKGPIAISG
jgi:hypothetical protein